MKERCAWCSSVATDMRANFALQRKKEATASPRAGAGAAPGAELREVVPPQHELLQRVAPRRHLQLEHVGRDLARPRGSAALAAVEHLRSSRSRAKVRRAGYARALCEPNSRAKRQESRAAAAQQQDNLPRALSPGGMKVFLYPYTTDTQSMAAPPGSVSGNSLPNTSKWRRWRSGWDTTWGLTASSGPATPRFGSSGLVRRDPTSWSAQ